MCRWAILVTAIGFLLPLTAIAAAQNHSLPYVVKCSHQKTQLFCKHPVKNADLGYRILAAHLPHCEGDCDLDWLGNDIYNKRNAQNNVYALSPDTYLLSHENAPVGAYGGGDVSLFLVTRERQSIRYEAVVNEKGERLNQERGWFYDPGKKLVGFSPLTNSAGMCDRTYFYTLSSTMLKLKNIAVSKETLQKAECSDVKEEIGAYSSHLIAVDSTR